MTEMASLKLVDFPYVKVYCEFPSKGDKWKNRDYAYSKVAKFDKRVRGFGYPEDARYFIHIYIHSYNEKVNQESSFCMSSCLLGYKYAELYASNMLCDSCSFSCKKGVLESEIEYGKFDDVVCVTCGEPARGRTWDNEPCPKCGFKKVKVLTEGRPHRHGFWCFELHILDREVTKTLCKFLGVDPIWCVKFSCKGSWHNFHPDSSGFDVCHVSCLDTLISARIHNPYLEGIELFKHVFPKEGKMLTGNNVVRKYWLNGEYRPVSEYHLKMGRGVPVEKR